MRGFNLRELLYKKTNLLIKLTSVIISIIFFICIGILYCSCGGSEGEEIPRTQHEGYLKDIYKDYFTVGAALNSEDYESNADLLSHYNSVTAMYQMKWGHLEPEEGNRYYRQADKFIEYAKELGMGVRGHTLVWYRNVPDWFINKNLSKEQALEYMNEHIEETIAHFKDAPIYAWDVVNEALHDNITQEWLDSGNLYRNAIDDKKHFERDNVFDWYSLCGPEYIEQAFKSAEAACKANGLDDMKLFYNDYMLNVPPKRDACVKMIKGLLDKGIRVDGIGMQSHYTLSSYLKDKDGWIKNFEAAIKAYTDLGLEVHITELDIDPGVSVLTEEVEKQQAEMYGKIFDVCRKYSKPWREGSGKVTNVTTWGIADSKENGSKYIFDNARQPKEAFNAITYF